MWDPTGTRFRYSLKGLQVMTMAMKNITMERVDMKASTVISTQE